jgi:hypothetical protein
MRTWTGIYAQRFKPHIAQTARFWQVRSRCRRNCELSMRFISRRHFLWMDAMGIEPVMANQAGALGLAAQANGLKVLGT